MTDRAAIWWTYLYTEILQVYLLNLFIASYFAGGK
jgi:hypothetical protein